MQRSAGERLAQSMRPRQVSCAAGRCSRTFSGWKARRVCLRIEARGRLLPFRHDGGIPADVPRVALAALAHHARSAPAASVGTGVVHGSRCANCVVWKGVGVAIADAVMCENRAVRCRALCGRQRRTQSYLAVVPRSLRRLGVFTCDLGLAVRHRFEAMLAL